MLHMLHFLADEDNVISDFSQFMASISSSSFENSMLSHLQSTTDAVWYFLTRVWGQKLCRPITIQTINMQVAVYLAWELDLREAFKRKRRKYIGLLRILRGYPLYYILILLYFYLSSVENIESPHPSYMGDIESNNRERPTPTSPEAKMHIIIFHY